MSISLIKIFENYEINLLPNKYKLACFEGFTSWLSENKEKNENLYAIKALLKYAQKKISPDKLSTFFFHILVMPPKLFSEEGVIFLLFLFIFDSLFFYLPNDISFAINPEFDDYIYMPVLGINIKINHNIRKIVKCHNKIYLIGNDTDTYLVENIKLHDKFKFIIANIPNKSLLYTAIMNSLSKYDTIEATSISSFKKKLIKAIDLILFVDSDFESRLDKLEFIIPLAYVSKDVTKSFTLSGLPHIVFLSDANSYLKIMENLIHESLHDELNVFMKFYELFYNCDQLYYSPWRNDPRPIRGILHAIYVFTGIYYFYNKFLKNEKKMKFLNQEEKNHIMFRYNLIHYELELSYLQLKNKNDELTQLGKELIEKLYSIYLSSKNLHISTHYPKSIVQHVKKWLLTNKEHYIELPQYSFID